MGYVEAILRVYNMEGRRDNKFKARVKILVHEKGLEALREEVETEVAARDPKALCLPTKSLNGFRAFFAAPALEPKKPVSEQVLSAARRSAWASPASSASNVTPHKAPGYGVVTVPLKAIGATPGDASADQMDAVADLAEDYSHDEVRVSHEQNLMLPHIALDDLPTVYDAWRRSACRRRTPARSRDIIACPGLDYCTLATARRSPSPSASPSISATASAPPIGPLKIKISGCINACGHHHVGHIGILGLREAGRERNPTRSRWAAPATSRRRSGQITGPGFSSENVVEAVETIVETYTAPGSRSRRLSLTLTAASATAAVQGSALRTKRRIGDPTSAHDVKLFGDQIAASRLRDALRPAQGLLLRF